MKKAFIAIFAVLLVVCLSIDAWYLGLLFLGKPKQIDYTNTIGDITLSDGTKVPVVQVKYLSNEENNGIEMLDICFNSIVTESADTIYSYGIQLTSTKGIDIVWQSDLYGCWQETHPLLTWKDDKQNRLGGYRVNTATTTATYYKGGPGGFITTTADDLTANLQLKISQDDGSIYKVTFRQPKNKDFTDMCWSFTRTAKKSLWGSQFIATQYIQGDPMYLVHSIYTGVKGLASGTSHARMDKLKNVFQFFEYKDGQYADEETTKSTLIESIINNYMCFDVQKLADGATKANESLFGHILGSQTYNSTGDYSSLDYIYGQGVVDVTINDCVMEATDTDNVFRLRLSDDFIKYYSKYQARIILRDCIDVSEYEANGITVTYDFNAFQKMLKEGS